ncbi:MAG TPA: amidohydrolase [Rubricoccaceae bacterium]|jgi:amidohydrolase
MSDLIDAAPVASPLSARVLSADLVELRQALHRRPEVGFNEHETQATLRAWLTERGFAPGPPLAGTGFTVEVEGTAPGAAQGPTVAYRTDMDALPITELSGADYASEIPGIMHACGHDAHMAIACGVALVARARADEMRGRLRILFQPNEERAPSGAPVMIRDGALDGVAAVYAVHVDPTIEVGRFGVKAGPLQAGCSPFSITISGGRSGHSARPHEVVDTVAVATHIASELYTLAGRVTDARRPAVLTLCRLRAGDALNVIPAEAEIGGTLRAVDTPTLVTLRDAVVRVAEGLAAAHNATATVAFTDLLPAVVNTPDEAARTRAAVADTLGEDAVLDLPLPSMGGEDFAYYLEHVPGALVRVGTAGSDATRYPLHDARFDLDERALGLASRVMAEVCLRDLADRA